MPKTVTNCPECGKTGIRSDHLKRHMETHKGNTPVSLRNTVTMKEADVILLDASTNVVKAVEAKKSEIAVKQAEIVAIAVQTLRERFPMEMFIEERKARCDEIKRGEHKWIWGTEECNERCVKSRNRQTCAGVIPWSIHEYGGQQQFDALYESWLKQKAGPPPPPRPWYA